MPGLGDLVARDFFTGGRKERGKKHGKSTRKAGFETPSFRQSSREQEHGATGA